MGDEEEDLLMELEAEVTAKTGAAMTWPSERYAYVKFGYDNTLKNQLASVGKSFNTWVDSVMTHVQAHYRHSSLPTKIQFKVMIIDNIRVFGIGKSILNIPHFQNMRLSLLYFSMTSQKPFTKMQTTPAPITWTLGAKLEKMMAIRRLIFIVLSEKIRLTTELLV